MRPYSLKTYRFQDHHDLTGTINALRCAAERFDEHAKACGEAFAPDHPVTKQFLAQAEQARRVANEMEEMADAH